MNILVTGANRGIGAALRARFAQTGRESQGTSRDGQIGLTLDVTDPHSIAALGAAYDGKALDLLVCNAGVYVDKGKTLAQLTADDWAHSLAVNVTGVAETVRVLMPALRRSTNGKIAIISSQMASQTNAPGGSYAYRASKAAVLNFGRNLAQDLRGDGIAVGNYHPGWVQTDMGGAAAEITESTAAAGLVDRFDALNMSITGCFQTWDGRDHAL
jgi:NAD(P)-dependent dehydrogenase (short-subunit alcohol dehydrogenase family)